MGRKHTQTQNELINELCPRFLKISLIFPVSPQRIEYIAQWTPQKQNRIAKVNINMKTQSPNFFTEENYRERRVPVSCRREGTHLKAK